MNNDQGQAPQSNHIQDMQSALFELRDRLMNLKMSLQDLACLHDEQGQNEARAEANRLLDRMRRAA